MNASFIMPRRIAPPGAYGIGIDAVPPHQIVMDTVLDMTPLLQHVDPVRGTHGAEPMSDDQDRRPLAIWLIFCWMIDSDS